MKNTFLSIVLLLIIFACKKEPKESVVKEVIIDTDDQNDKGWVSLFDGKTFDGWHNYKTDSISDEWQIEDGAMVFTPNEDRIHGINNIITDKQYSNFILSLEWKISKEGNSGVFWGIFEDDQYAVPYQTAPEIQILDNLNHPDKEKRTQVSGALFGIIGPDKNLMNDLGEWNHFLIKIDHKENIGSVFLNGLECIEFPLQGEAWNKMLENTKFVDWEGFGKYPTGNIGLQDHAGKVSFRNIKIKEL